MRPPTRLTDSAPGQRAEAPLLGAVMLQSPRGLSSVVRELVILNTGKDLRCKPHLDRPTSEASKPIIPPKFERTLAIKISNFGKPPPSSIITQALGRERRSPVPAPHSPISPAPLSRSPNLFVLFHSTHIRKLFPCNNCTLLKIAPPQPQRFQITCAPQDTGVRLRRSSLAEHERNQARQRSRKLGSGTNAKATRNDSIRSELNDGHE